MSSHVDNGWDLRAYAGAQRALERACGHETREDWYGWNDLVATLGTSYTGRPLPDCFREGERQWCYANSYLLARRISNLRYVEGLATGTGLILPLAHAWCVDEDDRVVDVTWTGSGDRCQGLDYLGVVIPLDEVDAARERNQGNWSVLDSDWLGGNQFLRTRWRDVLQQKETA
jgi:hypothetical protein